MDDWVTRGVPHIALEPEEVSLAPIYKLLIPENRGHAFYDEE